MHRLGRIVVRALGESALKDTRRDLADLIHFAAVAKHRNFRLAGNELGLSGSGLSHAIKLFEQRLGVRLFNRTTRSVTLTPAGETLLKAISQPIDALNLAFESLNGFRDTPSGRIRLNVPQDAALYLLAPILPQFTRQYPDIELDVVIDNRMVDVVAEGFDAGIRFGGTVPADMVSQRLSAEIRWFAAASPAYIEEHGEPHHPEDLLNHRCLKIRLGTGSMYKWEFKRGGERVTVDVPGAITIDESQFALALAERGAGFVYLSEAALAAPIAQQKLRKVLEEWAPVEPAYNIYYSTRKHVTASLRALIDFVRANKPLDL
jgi:DNA-binding transcriptional LysR family regulator